ncbi:MAG TPA: SNF2-related protein, partial [Candidatus Baltobacteraceae bacterium]|nr:SNF2-related protein [Candidatus Baltobacteraceae bacterium]
MSAPNADASDYAVEAWTEAIATWHAAAPARTQRDHIRYVIDIRENGYVPSLLLTANVVSILKSGSLSAPRKYELYNLGSGNAAFLQPMDRTIGRLISASGLIGGHTSTSPTILAALLDVLISTERLYWKSLQHPVLHREALENVHIDWRLDDDGRQRPCLAGIPSSLLIGTTPLWYVDPARAVAGPAQCAIRAEIAALLATAPALTAEQAARTKVSLREFFTSSGVVPPTAAIEILTIERDPVPVLRLGAFIPPIDVRGAAASSFATAELQFAYGDHTLAPSAAIREIRTTTSTGVCTWPRRTDFESGAMSRLQALGFTAIGWPHIQNIERDRFLLRQVRADDLAWIAFLRHAVPGLRDDGWRIEIDADFPYVIAEAGDEWTAELRESGERWFALDLGIEIEGARVPLLPILLDALTINGLNIATDLESLAARTEPVFGRLPSGAYVALQPARVARILATLGDVFDKPESQHESGVLTLSNVQAASMGDLDGTLSVRWNGRTLRNLKDMLAGVVDSGAVKLPPTFKATLRPYQREGVAWLQMLRKHEFGGVLADDMGLGKTIQLLAHVAIEKSARRLRAPVLIVAPTSVIPNWRAEIARFAPTLRIVSLTGTDRADRFAQLQKADIALTTYALLPRDGEYLIEREWSMVVL